MEKILLRKRIFACADPSIFNFLEIDLLIGKPAESINEVTISEKWSCNTFPMVMP